MRWRATATACAAILAASVAWADADDFARQWEVLGHCGGGSRAASVTDEKALQCEGAFALALDESVYRQSTRADLADVAAFNADGDELAFGPMPRQYGPAPGEWRDSAWFALPAPEVAAPGDLHLHVRRTTTGDLQLDASLSHSESPVIADLLVDVRAPGRAVEAIALGLRPGAADFASQVRVDASDDLQHWRTLVDAAAVAHLRQGGQALSRSRIDLPATQARYLRLHADGSAIPITGLRLLLQADRASRESFQRSRIAADYVGRDGPAYLYRLPARVPVDRVAVELGSDNTVAQFSISAREPGAARWTYIGQLTAFRLRGAGVALDNESVETPVGRWREWRIEPNTPLRLVPVLRMDYRPETWILLTHGPGPYVVAAGSSRAQRQDFPLEALVGRVRARYGRAWNPAEAGLGPMRMAGGEAAVSAYDPQQRRTWILWGLLTAAAAAIIVMVWRLLGSPADS